MANPEDVFEKECKQIDRAFERVRDIAQNYLDTYYPEAPDPMLYAIEIEKTLKEVELL